MLEARGVRKRYGTKVALDGVDLEVRAGEVCGLLGRNGAGKTTLLSIVTGLLRADEGSVTVGDVDVRRDPYQVRRLIGYAPQELGIYPLVRVRDNLVLFGELAGLRRRALRERVEEVAAVLGLEPLLDRQAGLMSGGEQRRLHTAMALLHSPPLVLLDEPTVGADVGTRGDLITFVRTLAEDGAAVCYSTHYLAEIETLEASVALIEQGQIIARGSVRELVDRHSDSAVDLQFDGPAPALELDAEISVHGSLLRIHTSQPAAVAAQAMGSLGADAPRLLGVDFVRPSLESVFIALTGSRYDPDKVGSDEAPVRTLDERTRA
jgi:ABC-2 type transport system ATP-binding protein